jgi:hypothetical protein
MIKNAGPLGETGLTPLVLLKGSIDTVIYLLILRFSWPQFRPQFSSLTRPTARPSREAPARPRRHR